MTPLDPGLPLSLFNYFGPDFELEATRVEPDDLPDIKRSLKSTLADSNLRGTELEEKWSAIDQIRVMDRLYVLVTLKPETRLPDYFTELDFTMDQVKPESVTPFYRLSLERGARPVVVFGTGFSSHRGNMGFGMGSVFPVSQSPDEEWSHSYEYLLLFPEGTPFNDNSVLKVRFHNGVEIKLGFD